MRGDRGYTLIETMMVVGIIAVIGAIVIPITDTSLRGSRLRGDAAVIRNLVGVAKMRASGQFTRARVYADLGARTYVLQVWDRTNNVWVDDGGLNQLSTGVNFGFAALNTPPPNTQVNIAQSPLCTTGLTVAEGTTGNTACVTFSSRGMPVSNVLPPGGGVVGNSALYLTDGSSVYGTTVTTTPLIKFWWAGRANAAWVRQ